MAQSLPDERHARLSVDTSRAVEARQVEGWRRMSSVEVAETITAAWHAGTKLAWLGLKERYPDASDEELRLRQAVMTLGRSLAERVHPAVRTLADR